MTNPSTFLDSLRSLSDDELSTLLARDSEFLKKAQKALVDAKRKEAEASRARAQEQSLASGKPFDLKSWMKIKRLVTGPRNEATAAEFAQAQAKTCVDMAPEGEKSLFCASMDYLADRDRVDLTWPMAIFKASPEIGPEELKSFFSLYSRRNGISGLGGQSREMWNSVMKLPLPWAQHEKALLDGKTISKNLLATHLSCAASLSHYDASDPAVWQAMRNLALAGCEPLEVSRTAYNSTTEWQALLSRTVSTPAAAEAKVEAFEVFIDKGWCDMGFVSLTDNLRVRGQSGSMEACGSRSAILSLVLHPSSLEIFHMICDRETEIGFPRYDEVGRSRLYFINERMRGAVNPQNADAEKNRKILLAMAQRALDHGDAPESVNAQNPQAKCCDDFFADMIGAAIEKRELGANANAPAAPRKRAASL